MGVTKIQWTSTVHPDGTITPGYSFNPWRGCTKVSEGCANCYAETMSGRNPRVLGEWGPDGTRVVAAEAQWRLPVKWDAEARKDGRRRRVFCASLADVFEGPETMPAHTDYGSAGPDTTAVPRLVHDDVAAARERLFQLIDATPMLDWLLLTKRPQNVVPLYGTWLHFTRALQHRRPLWPDNLWVGTSVENQARAEERLPALCAIPAKVRFVSFEPLLESVDPRPWLGGPGGVHWAIVGGESGPHARPFDPDWARYLLDMCHDDGVAFFMKQLGENVPGGPALKLRNKGGDLDDIPPELRVREFPTPA